MIRPILFAFLSLLTISLNAQTDTIYEKVFYMDNYDVKAKSIAPTHEDGAVILGSISFQNSTITKVDSAGAILWNRALSSGSPQVYPGLRLERVIHNSDSAYSAVGINYNGATQKLDLCLLRFNSDGDTLWTRFFNQSVSSHFNGTSIYESVDSCLLLSGYNEVTYHSFLMKLDLDGNILWQKELYTSNNSRITSITQAEDSTIYIGGWGQAGSNPLFSFVSALDHSGNILYSKEINNFTLNDMHHRDNSLFLLGYGEYAPSMVRLEDDGSAINWAYTYVLAGSFDTYERMKLTPLQNGDFATVNPDQFFSTALIRVDPTGMLTEFHPMMLNGCALIETKKKGHMVLGSGPLYGVHILQFSHLGLIRMDSLYTAGECYGFQSPNQLSLNVALTDFSWFEGGDLLPVNNSITVGDTNFVEYYGCVQVYGSLNELEQAPQIKISPNPASNYVEISQEDGLPMTIVITDIMGRIIYQNESPKSKHTLDLSTYEEATYFIRANFENNEYNTGKIVVNH